MSNKNKKERLQKNFTKKVQDRFNIDLLICLIIISLLFIPTLNRPWLIYDERIFTDGLYFPIPKSFSEMLDIINTFGLNFSVSSSNLLYSSNYVFRSCPFSLLLRMTVSLFTGINPLLNHLFSLSLHLVNTALLYFILKCFINSKNNNLNKYLPPFLCLLWALHPVNMESVLLTTNFGATYAYIFFFGFLLDFIKNKELNKLTSRRIIIATTFLISMITNEYIIALPLILFIFSFNETYKNSTFKKALEKSFLETIPYFIGLGCYIFYFLLFTSSSTNHIRSENLIINSLERVFWLSPQLFFHFIKLIFFPLKLSIDQTVFVRLGKSLFDPYAIFCILFLALWLFIPLFLFVKKKKNPDLFLLCFSFFFALLPFLHILMPSYALVAERYLYTPLALLIIVLGKIISDRTSHKFTPAVLLTLSLVLILCIGRSYYRTLDWRDNYTFINSTYKVSNSSLFKAVRLGMLGKAISILEPNETTKAQKCFEDTLILLKKAKEEILEEKLSCQNKQPQIIKSYGLDYNSLLTKTAYLEASSRYLELKQDYKVGLRLLESSITNIEKTDPRVLQLYAHFLISDKQYDKAKEILLKIDSTYPNTPFILLDLINFYSKYEKNLTIAEKYLIQALKLVPYDQAILFKALDFYQESNDPVLIAKYSYLYGLRTQSKAAYKQALSFYLNLGDFKNARKTVNKLEKIALSDPEALFFISKYYYKIKDYRKALNSLINSYSIAKEINASPILRFDITLTLAKLFLYLGDKEKAISLSQETISLSGNDKESLIKAQLFLKSLGLNKNVN